ncbi:pyridoxal phosphate-dependent transferase [Kalaharituber pfeilii]|nr:pyridoxal phosphate-dependent transferase [Kalaharituber pfeilii]
MDIQDAYQLVNRTIVEFSTQFRRVPGSAILLRYIKSNYQNDPVRSAIELFLFLFAVRYLLAPKYSTRKENYVKLREDEIDELIEEWQPEPLVAEPTDLEQVDLERTPTIAGPTGYKVKLTTGKTVVNFSSYNIFNLAHNDYLKDRAIATLRAYGVGPCGPPGFYGTQDLHMKTESDVANFLGVPACIMYAQAFHTISAVIPAFSKRGDIIVADKGCNYAIQKGLQISRSIIRWYEHNDMADLERVLQKVAKEQAKKPLTRRFIVTEGLFENYGDMCDLPKIMELKEKYKYRLILDETYSFLTLGRTGRGITEHQNVDPNMVDMIVGSLSHYCGAGGGFCVGSEEIVEHQRISGAAYVFSAALPGMLATTASETIHHLQVQAPELLTHVRELTKLFRQHLEKSDLLECTSSPENPMCLIKLRKVVLEERGIEKGEQEDKLLQDIVDEVLNQGFMITRVKALPGVVPHQPKIKIVIGVGHTKKEVEKAAATIRQVAAKLVGKFRK